MLINKKALGVVIAGLAVIAAIIYFVFIYNYNKTTVPPSTDTAPAEVTEPISVESVSPVSTGTPATKEELAVQSAQRLALSFAARYGSSSNQSAFSNLSDLEVFMTDALIERTRQYVAAEIAKPSDTSKYSGVTTTAVAAEFKTLDDAAGTAQATVKTKRQETAADGSLKNYDQSLALALKKVNGEWKVDSAEWLK